MPPRRRCKMAVRTIKGILQRRHTEQGEPSHSLTGEGHGRGEESGMHLEELHGVWGAECHHSGYRNKRDLRWSVDHTYRKPCYKPQGETQDDAAGEVGGGHISAESRDNTTRPEERTSAFIGPSGEVSDDACRKRPIPSDRQLTTTPAQAIPGGQEVSEPKVPRTV